MKCAAEFHTPLSPHYCSHSSHLYSHRLQAHPHAHSARTIHSASPEMNNRVSAIAGSIPTLSVRRARPAAPSPASPTRISSDRPTTHTRIRIVRARRRRARFCRAEMHRVCLAFALALLVASQHAHAQTYDPRYPVCMQIYGPVGYFDCGYDSLAQCRHLAVGRSASCTVNPYFPRSKSTPPRRSGRAAGAG